MSKQIHGKRATEFFAAVLDQTVLVAVATGKAFKGTLVGVDVYDVILRQESGLEILLPKGNIVYLHRVAP